MKKVVICPYCKKAEMELIDGYWCCHECKAAVTACEVYSRVVGYLRPVNQWHKGKKQEFQERTVYKPWSNEDD